MQIGNHLIVSTAAYIVVTQTILKESVPHDIHYGLWWLVVMAGTFLPDIDHPESSFGRRVKWLSWPIYLLFGHRGITHSLIALLLFWGLYLTTQNPFVFWLGFGWASHLLGDYLTDSGIPLFWPQRRRYRFALVGSTSGITELIMVVLVIIASVYLVLA